MEVQVCPIETIEAPAESVWQLVVNLARFQEWTDAKVVKPPARPLRAGDRFQAVTGFANLFRVSFDVLEVKKPSTFALDVHLPFGLVNHEVLEIAPLAPERCRVIFN